MQRRHFLLSPLAIAWHRARAEVTYPQVERGVALVFPRDHGSHPAFRTEWWYVTGVAGPDSEGAKPIGLTFIGVRHGDRSLVREYNWTGDRAFNRAASVEAAIELATEILS